MTTTIEFSDLPSEIAQRYNPLDVRKITRRASKDGSASYTVITFRGMKDVWRQGGDQQWKCETEKE